VFTADCILSQMNPVHIFTCCSFNINFNATLSTPQTKFSSEKLKGRDHAEGWENNIRMDLREKGDKVWTGFIWFRIGTNGGLL
jgi:hypothetical protein